MNGSAKTAESNHSPSSQASVLSEPFAVAMFGNPIGPWHRWFAWRPVNTTGHGWKWLRVVERQRQVLKPHLSPRFGNDTWWLYRQTDNSVREPAKDHA